MVASSQSGGGEFQALPNFADEHCRDAQAKHLAHQAHQQAVAFHLPATQKAVHSTWLTPTSLMELRRKEHLGPKDSLAYPQLPGSMKRKTIALGIVLQWCAIQSGAPPDTFYGAVQELHWHLALVVEEIDWPNMEEEIWAGVMNDPMVAASSRPPTPRRTLLQTLGVEKPVAAISLSASESEGMTPPQDLALVPRRQPPSPLGFSPQVPEDL